MGFKNTLKSLGLALGLSLIVAMATAYCFSRSASDKLQVAERRSTQKPDGTLEVYERIVQTQSDSTRIETWGDGFERIFGSK